MNIKKAILISGITVILASTGCAARADRFANNAGRSLTNSVNRVYDSNTYGYGYDGSNYMPNNDYGYGSNYSHYRNYNGNNYSYNRTNRANRNARVYNGTVYSGGMAAGGGSAAGQS